MRAKLVKMRKAAGYTQKTFADKVGTSRSHYSQIESGEKNPSLNLSIRIKRCLNYLYDDIFFNYK